MQNTRSASRKPLILFIAIITPVLCHAQWAQIGQTIYGENTGDLAGYGHSLSSDGTRFVIGARYNDEGGTDAGQARVFNFNGSEWELLGNKLPGEAPGDQFGYAVAISGDGNRIAVGAVLNSGAGTHAGHVRIFEFNGTQWVQVGADIDGEASGDESGRSVALSYDGHIVAIGAIHNNGNAGHVRVFQNSGSTWSLIGEINGQSGGDNAGFSVSLSDDGHILAVGAILNDGNGTDAGQVRVFKYESNNWNQMGSSLNGEAAGDFFGTAVDLSSDGNTLAVGADHNDGAGTESGHVRVFYYNGNAWVQLGPDINGEAAGDESGYSVSLSAGGSRIAIGARRNNSGGNPDAGHVRVFDYSMSAWVQAGIDIDGEDAGDEFGCSVSLSGDGAIVSGGAQAHDGNGFSNSGQVRVFGNNTPLPVELLDFQVRWAPEANYLFWKTGIESQCRVFQVERSADGRVFEKIGEIPATGSGAAYNYKDVWPVEGLVFYRLKIIDFDGSFQYSPIEHLAVKNSQMPLVYPVLFSRSITVCKLRAFNIFDTFGRLLFSAAAPDCETWDTSLFMPGSYILSGTDVHGNMFSIKLVKM